MAASKTTRKVTGKPTAKKGAKGKSSSAAKKAGAAKKTGAAKKSSAKRKAPAAKRSAPAAKRATPSKKSTKRATPGPAGDRPIATATGKSTGVFLIKSEPVKYPWSRLVEDGRTAWDGVRNFEARNNLRAMREGDLLLYYHSNEGKEIVGVARVVKTAYPDPAVPDEDWAAVDIAPAFPLAAPVTLDTLRNTEELKGIQVVTRPRISVVPITQAELATILKLGKTEMPEDARGSS